MQLDKNTIKKLEQLKNENEAKIQRQRGNLMKWVMIDQKFNLTIDNMYREEAKGCAEAMFALRQEVCKLDGLIEGVKEAAESLGIGNFEFGHERMRYVSAIAANDQTLKQGVIKGVLSREKCADLEAVIKEAESKLK